MRACERASDPPGRDEPSMDRGHRKVVGPRLASRGLLSGESGQKNNNLAGTLTLTSLSVHPLLLLARFTTFEPARSMRWLGCWKYPPIPPFPRMRVCGTPRPRIKEMPFLADRAAVAVKGMALFGQLFVPYFYFCFTAWPVSFQPRNSDCFDTSLFLFVSRDFLCNAQ